MLICYIISCIFFISFLALQGYRQRELILIGSVFILAVFLTYLGIGLGIFNFFYHVRRNFQALVRDYNVEIDVTHFQSSIADLFDPAKINVVNHAIGGLSSRTNLTGGHWERTLASYNAGKSRVDEWLTWADYKEPSEFVETIPFTETRDYVQAVMRNADIYRRLYKQ